MAFGEVAREVIRAESAVKSLLEPAEYIAKDSRSQAWALTGDHITVITFIHGSRDPSLVERDDV